MPQTAPPAPRLRMGALSARLLCQCWSRPRALPRPRRRAALHTAALPHTALASEHRHPHLHRLHGIIAVLVQWRKRDPAKPLIPLALTSQCTLVLFISIQILAVAHVEVPAADQDRLLRRGFHAPQRPPCEDSPATPASHKKLGFDEAIVDGYFGDTQIASRS